MKKLIAGLLAVALLTPAMPVYGIDEPDSEVSVDDVVISQCGPHTLVFSGQVIISDAEALRITLDGAIIGNTIGNPLNFTSVWSSDPMPVDVGTHLVGAVVFDTASNDIVDSDSLDFTLDSCEDPDPTPTPTSTPSPTPSATPTATPDSSNSSSNGGNSGGNDEQPKPAAKKGQVKGATIKKVIAGAIPNKMVPATVARIFKEVFGRAIKPFESAYWKFRARTDKVTESLLKGTMEWYKAHGKTVGK